MPRTKRIVLIASGLILTIGLLEGLLFVSRVISPDIARLLGSPWDGGEPATIDDSQLVNRPNPKFPGHDDRGFRNPTTLTKADIVALGDSQTYGTGVTAENAWPQVLASKLGHSVYGMALGGYGPVHSLILWPEAQSLQPKTIIEAFYFGNDFFDSFDLVYAHEQHSRLRSSEAEVVKAIAAAEALETLTDRVDRAFLVRLPDGADQQQKSKAGSANAAGFVAKYSGLYGLVRRARYEYRRGKEAWRLRGEAGWQAERKFAEDHAEYCQIFSDDKFRTVFTSEYRLLALDQSDIRIAEGFRLSLQAIRTMGDRAKAQGIRFVVLLIPTKETVFAKRWLQPSEHFIRLVDVESQAQTAAVDFFRQHKIEFVDALPALRNELETTEQPYPASWDGHPNEVGHKVIAQTVADYLSSAPFAAVASP